MGTTQAAREREARKARNEAAGPDKLATYQNEENERHAKQSSNAVPANKPSASSKKQDYDETTERPAKEKRRLGSTRDPAATATAKRTTKQNSPH